MFSATAMLLDMLKSLLAQHANVNRMMVLVCGQALQALRGCLRLSHLMQGGKKTLLQKRYGLIDMRKSGHWAENTSCLRHTDTSITFPLEDSFVLITDIVGSTRLYNDDPIRMKGQVDLHDSVAKRLVRAFGGHIVANEGDSFAFAFPDIYSAVNFGINFRDQLEEHGVDFSVRMGINSGLMCARNLCGYKLLGAPVEEITALIRHSSGAKICIKDELLEAHQMKALRIFCIH